MSYASCLNEYVLCLTVWITFLSLLLFQQVNTSDGRRKVSFQLLFITFWYIRICKGEKKINSAGAFSSTWFICLLIEKLHLFLIFYYMIRCNGNLSGFHCYFCDRKDVCCTVWWHVSQIFILGLHRESHKNKPRDRPTPIPSYLTWEN